MPATLSRNLELILGARDKLTGPLRKMQAGFDRFKTYAAGAVKVVAAALAAATTAAVAFGKASVDAFAAFDTSMRDTWTLLKIGQDEFAALGDSIIDMTKRVPQSPQQLGSAIYDIISAGVGDTSEALIVLEQSALAATAGVTTTKDAAGAAVGIMNAFGKTTADIPEIFDLLFQTVNKGVVTFSELGPAASRTAASFQGAGASIQDMLGAMAFMTKTVGNANESSTKLRATMRALTKSAPELKKELGTAVFDAAGNFRGLKDVVGDLTKSLAGLTKEDQLTKIRKLFPEQEAQDAIVAMVNNYDLLASTLDDVADSQGAMNAAAEKQMGSWNNQMQIMKNAFTGIKTALGEVITAIAGPELQGFTAWLQGIQDELVRNKAAIIAYARTILPVLGSAFNTVADVVKQAFGIAWDIVKDFFMGLRHSPRQALIILGGIISAIPGLFWDVFKRALGVVGEVAKVIFTPLQGAFVFILDNIRFQIQDKLQGNLIEFLNWLISKANWVREKLGQEPWELFEKPPAAEAALTFEETWATSIQQLSERFASLGQESKDAIVKTVDDVAAVFTEIAGIMKNEMVSPAMETKLRELQNTLAAIPGTLQQGYEDAAAAATAAGAKAETALAKVKAAREAAAAPPPAPGAGGGTGGGDADKQAKSFGEVFGGAFGMALGFAGGNAIASLVGMLFSAINEGDVGGFVDNMIDGALTLIEAWCKAYLTS